MFRQEWPNGANMSTHTQVTSGWPTLGSALSSPQLGYLQYEGSSAGMMTKTGYFPSGITGGIAAGALAVSDKTDVVVMSQLNNFLGGGMDPVNASRAQGGYPAIAMGISGKYNRLPIGFSSEAVLVSESTAGSSSFGKPAGGFNRGITAWGDILLQRHGKARPSVKKSPADLTDLKANYLGYSTTAFYHHNECDGNSTTIPNCITWEDTLVAVNDDLKARGVPSKWMLIDSYWYGEDLFNGALLWEDDPMILAKSYKGKPPRFPHGLKWFANRTGLTGFQAHNGHWNPNTPYCNKSEPAYYEQGWMKSAGDRCEFPQGTALWNRLFERNKQWGLRSIKQDHINENAFFPSNIEAWSDWFDGMGEAAQQHGITIMYCMAWAPVLLNSVTVAAADSTRASSDYIVGRAEPGGTNGQWAIGLDSIWHWALGLRPYKDTFYSNSSGFVTNPSINIYKQKENCPTLHGLMAVLSTAPVAISDGVDMANVSLVQQLVRQDGLVLKPDEPVTATDTQIWKAIAGAESSQYKNTFYTTQTTIGTQTWGYVTTVDSTEAYNITLSDLGLNSSATRRAAYRYDFGPLHRPTVIMATVDAEQPLLIEATAAGSHCEITHWVLAPILPISNLAVLGETSKFVPVSRNRIKAYTESTSEVVLTLEGVPGEIVEIGYFKVSQRSSEMAPVYRSCTIPTAARVEMHLLSGDCTTAE